MKKTVCVLLSLVMLISVTAGLDFSAYADTLYSSGWCGDNAKYTFDSATGTLTVSGTGEIDFDVFTENSSIKKLIVKKGIDGIEYAAFYNCQNLSSVTLPDGIKYIGQGAFYNTKYYKNKKNWKSHALISNKYLLASDDNYFEKQHSKTNGKNVTYAIPKGVVLITADIYNSFTKLYVPTSVKYFCTIADSFYHTSQPNYIMNIKYEGTKKEFGRIKIHNGYFAVNDNYSASEYFNVRAKSVKYNIAYPVSGLTVKGAKKSITAKWKKQARANGYQVQYSLKSNMSSAKIKTLSGANKTSVKIKKLKAKKKYYVRVRSYRLVGGKKVYGRWTGKKAVRAK